MKSGRKFSELFVPKSDSIVKLPCGLRKFQFAILLLTVLSTAINELFVFLFQGATDAFGRGMNMIGVVLFFIYLMKKPLFSIFEIILSQISIKFDEKCKIDVIQKCMSILGITKGKVKNGLETIGSTTILDGTSQYISEHCRLVLELLKKIIGICTFMISFVGLVSIALNTFDKLFFSISLSVTFVLVIVVTIWQVKKNKIFSNEQYQAFLVQQQEKNDAININPISTSHMDYMVDNFSSSIIYHSKSVLKENMNFSICNLIKNFCLGLAVVSVILNATFTVGISNITPEAFLSFVSLATIYENVLNSLSGKIHDIQSFINQRNALVNKRPMFMKIIEVYNSEKAVEVRELETETLKVDPFSFSYNEEFRLVNSNTLIFEKGKMTLIKGPSGAGKSTLLNVLSGELYLKGRNKYKTVHFSSDRTLGCKNLLREITFEKSEKDVDRDRLVEILKGVCLYDEFIKKANGEDILAYLTHTFKENLSTGLDQRVMLARTLYRIDDGDIVIIDEPIGALDRATAVKVLDYIKKYACDTKGKLVVITTHQYYIYDGFDRIIELDKKGRETTIKS